MRRHNIHGADLPGELIEMALARLGWLLVRWGFALIAPGDGVGMCANCGPRLPQDCDEEGCCSTCGADAWHVWHVFEDAESSSSVRVGERK